MADELNFGASFDASQVIEGLSNVASKFESTASQVTASFNTMASAEAPFGAALDSLFESMISTSAGLETLTPAEAAFGAALDAALPALEATNAALLAIAPAEAAFATALESLLEPMIAVESAGAGLATDLVAIGPAASEVAVGLSSLSISAAEAAAATGAVGPEAAASAGAIAALEANVAQAAAAFEVATVALSGLNINSAPIEQYTLAQDTLLQKTQQLIIAESELAQAVAASGVSAGSSVTETSTAASAVTGLGTASEHVVESEVELAGALDLFVESVIGLGEVLAEAGVGAVQMFGHALEGIAGPLTAASALAPTLSGAVEALAHAFQNLVAPLLATGDASTVAATGLEEVGTAATSVVGATEAAAIGLETLAGAGGAAAGGVSAAANATAVATESVVASGAAFEASGQGILNFGAAASATATSAAAAGAGAASAATGFAAAGAAAAGAAEGAIAANISFAEGVTISRSAAAALQFLNSAEERAGATSQEIVTAWEKVKAEGARLGLECKKLGENFIFVALTEEELIQKNSQLVNGLASASARLGAIGVGAGGAGYSIGLLARQVPLLGQALAYAFPVIGAVFLAETVSTLIDRFDQMQTAIRKTSQQFDDMASASIHSAEALELQNLKLEDQIKKLEGSPVENRLKEALLENTMQAQDLSRELQDATEKAIELLKTGEIGFIRSALTGKEETKDFRAKVEPELVAYRAAQVELQNLSNSTDEYLKAHAATRVEDARQAILKTTQDEINAVKIRQAARAVELQKAKTGAPDEYGRVETIPGLSPKDAGIQAQQQFEPLLTMALDLNTKYKEAAISAQHLLDIEKNRTAEAALANKVASELADKTRREPDIAGAEESGKKLAEAQKDEASATYRMQQETIKLQVDLDVMGGTERLQAEQDVASRILTARRKLTADLLDAQKTANEAELTGLQQRAILIADDERGPKQTADLQTNANKQAQLVIDNQTKIDQIVRDGEAAELALTEQGARQKIASVEKAATQTAQIAQRETQSIITIAATRESEESAKVKSAAELKLSAIQNSESLGLITIREASAQRIAILREEETQLKAILAEEIATLTAQQTALQATLTTVAPGSTAAKELNDTYARLSNTIAKLSKDQANLNTEFDKDVASTQLKAAKDIEKAWVGAYTSIANAFNKSVSGMITGQETLLQAARNIYLSIADLIISSILKAAERWVFEHVVMLVAEKYFHVQSITAAHVAEATKAAAGKAAQLQQIAQQAALSTALDISYAKDTIAYTAAETAKTGAAKAGVAARLAATITEGAGDAALVAEKIATAALVIGADTAQAEADVFLQAIESVPFPANLVAAPAAAATVKAEMAGFTFAGIAEHGALLRTDMPIFAHAQEMILPSGISTGLQNVISTGSVGGGGSSSTSINVKLGNVHAVDAEGVAALLKKQSKNIARDLEKSIRSGHLNLRRAI